MLFLFQWPGLRQYYNLSVGSLNCTSLTLLFYLFFLLLIFVGITIYAPNFSYLLRVNMVPFPIICRNSTPIQGPLTSPSPDVFYESIVICVTSTYSKHPPRQCYNFCFKQSFLENLRKQSFIINQIFVISDVLH